MILRGDREWLDTVKDLPESDLPCNVSTVAYAIAAARRDIIIAVAVHLADATLVGNPAPKVARMNERIRSPQVGDLVVEMSVLYGGDADRRSRGFGILIEHRDEWWTTDEEWATAVAEYKADDPEWDEPRSVDHAWYVQYGPRPGDICRWTNCSFIVIPTDRDAFRLPVGTRDEHGVTLTRDDLLGTLADSGFEPPKPLGGNG